MSVLISQSAEGVRVESIELPDAIEVDADEQVARYGVAMAIAAHLFPNSIGLALADVIERERGRLRLAIDLIIRDGVWPDSDDANKDVEELVSAMLFNTAELIADGSKLGGLTLVKSDS